MKHFFVYILLLLNLVAVFALGVASISVYLSPEKLWFAALFGMAYPYLLLINLIFIVLWAIIKPWFTLFSIVIILAGYEHIGNYLQFSGKRTHEKGIRVTSYNVKYFMGTTDFPSKENADHILNFLRQNDADIIFENANRSEFGCDYTFKVKQDKISLVLEKIALLDPEALNENTRTIKAEVDYYADETKRLTDRLASLDKTLADAIASYDAVARTATANGDVTALAQVIDSKLAMMERIEQSRTDILTQLEQIKKGESEVLEKMDFVYFYINVYKDAVVEGDSLKDSWFVALKELVMASN